MEVLQFLAIFSLKIQPEIAERSMSQEKFSIGLILGETVSAGAYTAGVLDFLIEALDEWHRLKADAPQ
ncbi:MAG: hypothetical protein CMM46_15185 [Rhodospirillaceae bacterium]|nr:hypothetical protein [Rhodospirillaceae bacterium]